MRHANLLFKRLFKADAYLNRVSDLHCWRNFTRYLTQELLLKRAIMGRKNDIDIAPSNFLAPISSKQLSLLFDICIYSLSPLKVLRIYVRMFWKCLDDKNY